MAIVASSATGPQRDFGSDGRCRRRCRHRCSRRLPVPRTARARRPPVWWSSVSTSDLPGVAKRGARGSQAELLVMSKVTSGHAGSSWRSIPDYVGARSEAAADRRKVACAGNFHDVPQDWPPADADHHGRLTVFHWRAPVVLRVSRPSSQPVGTLHWGWCRCYAWQHRRGGTQGKRV